MTIQSLSALHASAAPLASAPAASVADAGPGFALELAGLERTAAFAGKGGQSGLPGPLQQFEGFVLRTFVEAMLPAENTSFFGSGTAGNIWRSMLAEKLGDEIAASGGVGIAGMLAAAPSLEAGSAQDALKDEARKRAVDAGALSPV